MKIASGRVLDRLPAEERCLGALFTSYSFDPAFFEEHVVRAVLRLASDPVEQAERFHHEARRALQETPVVAIVDAGERRPGRRLPFDLLEVSDVVFHPKMALLLYRKRARCLIGSGNLTSSGYGGNTELFLCLDLEYDDPADAPLLSAIQQHIVRLAKLVRRPGTQLELFRQELRRRLQSVASGSRPSSMMLLDSITGPIIEQVAALLPENAVIHTIGMLAPFFERDDAGDLDVTSVFGALAPRTAKNAVLDVGVAWDNPQVQASDISQLDEGFGRIWTWSYEDGDTRALEHLVPVSVGSKTLHYLDDVGKGRRWPLDEVLEAIEERVLWQQPSPVVFAPKKALAAAAKRFEEVRLWLHPSTRLFDGRPLHRPLHAKLLLLGFRSGSKHGTLLVVGSANMSRRALLMPAGPGQGNVELALAFRINATLSLRDVVPELVCVPSSAVEVREREFPDLERNYALAIEEATHDPKQRSLLVTWSQDATEMPPWRLTYDEEELARSDTPPTASLEIPDFVLKPSTAEVVLHVGDREYPAPILVTDLVALPAVPAGPAMGLEELLMLLARRMGAERAVQIAHKRGPDGPGELGSFFGDGFGPTDVFRAWWAVAEDLRDPTLSVSAFRLRLEGALGVGAAWSCMLDAMQEQHPLPPEEVWFYGAELLRSLAEIDLPATEDRQAKAEVLSSFCATVRADLGRIELDAGTRPWVKRVFSFYGQVRA